MVLGLRKSSVLVFSVAASSLSPQPTSCSKLRTVLSLTIVCVCERTRTGACTRVSTLSCAGTDRIGFPEIHLRSVSPLPFRLTAFITCNQFVVLSVPIGALWVGQKEARESSPIFASRSLVRRVLIFCSYVSGNHQTQLSPPTRPSFNT